MKIKNIKIENFRLLDNVEMNLEDITTAIVGKNNSGKTSFSEILNIFMNGRKFEFEDFSIKAHQNFYDSYFYFTQINSTNKEENIKEIIQTIPKIKLTLTIEYMKNDNWNNIKPFISSLEENNEIKILFEYSPKDSEKFLAKQNGMKTESQISTEHVVNNKAVRETLISRGITPENLPAEEE